MGDFGANGAEVRGSACGFLVEDHKKKEKWLRYGSWRHFTEKKSLHRAGTQPLQTYVDKRQASVAGWVSLQPIF